MEENIFTDNILSIKDCIDLKDSYGQFFKLNFHQIIPKYYLLSNDNIRKVILSYSMGSGKTASAVFIISHYLNYIKKQNLLIKTGLLETNKHDQKIFVIGNFTTINAIRKELIKPEFGLVNEEIITEIVEKQQSRDTALKNEGEVQFQKLLKKIEKNIVLLNFQALFNRCFPELRLSNLVQEASSLIESFESGRITINKDILNTMRNSLVVVDEFQKMYTSQYGINSYGFVIGALMKRVREYNIKFVFLSGTMLNTSPGEVVYINSILNEEHFLNQQKYIRQEKLIDKIPPINMLKKEYEDEMINMLANNFLYYNQKELDSNNKTNIKKSDIILPIKYTHSKVLDENLQVLEINPINKSLPVERYIGNTLLKTKSGSLLNLYSIPLQDIQNKLYEENQNKSLILEETSFDDINLEQGYNVRDVGIDNEIKKGLLNNIFRGKCLKEDQLYKYSAIGYEMLKICHNASFRKEKVIIYNDKITHFGLIQYMNILTQNGFVEFGQGFTEDSICRECGKTPKHHNSTRHHFKPIYVSLISGITPLKDRERITRIYNSPQNLYGDLISVLFISSIAQAGISFMNTNNLIILNRINNLSRFYQICGRIVRTHSHDLLPEDKHFVNIYPFIVNSESEKENSIDKDYYMLRLILNEHITNFMNKMNNKSVTSKVFNDKKGYLTRTEQDLLVEDIQRELKLVINRINFSNDNPWMCENLLNYIQSNEVTLSFIDFSKVNRTFLSNNLLLLNLIRKKRFNHLYLKDDVCFPFVPEKKEQNDINSPKIYDSDFDNFIIDESVINHYKEDIKKCYNKIVNKKGEDGNNYKVKCELLLNKIMKTVKGNINDFKDMEEFWKLIYHIHDEYYEDDENNFIINHCSKNRNFKKIKGLYYGKEVIYLNGDRKTITQVFKKLEPLIGFNRIYTISSETNSYTGNNWFIKVVIVENVINKFGEETTLVNNCLSYDIKQIRQDFNFDEEISKKNFCYSLIEKVCDIIHENKEDEKLITPFNIFTA